MNGLSDCLVKGCDREQHCKGLCHGHYQQQRRGAAFKPLRGYREVHKDQAGRVCTKCDQYKPWSEFYATKTRCKPCYIEGIRERREAA